MTLKDSIVASCQKMCDTDHNFFPGSGGVKGKICRRVFIYSLFMVADPLWGFCRACHGIAAGNRLTGSPGDPAEPTKNPMVITQPAA
jgi:hypothetical protein